MISATRAFRDGRVEEAAIGAAQALKADSGNLEALLMLGVIAAKKRVEASAIPMLQQVVERDPDSYDATYWLSMCLRRASRSAEALIAAERAVALRPDQPHALYQLGICLLEAENWAAAERALKTAAKLAPNVPSIQFSYGVALDELGKSSEAATALRRAIALNPRHFEAMHRLGMSLAHGLDYRGAFSFAEQILQLDPNSPIGHSLAAVALVGLNNTQDAYHHSSQALNLAPDNPEILTLHGTLLQAVGMQDEAKAHLYRSIELEPRQGYAYYALVRTQRLQLSDLEFVQKMVAISEDPTLPRRYRGDIEFAIGKAFADLGEYRKSMDHYNLGNKVAREGGFGQKVFDSGEYKQGVDFAIRNLNRAFVDRYVNAGIESDLPIFVVGMMRSGTTLVEQILSSHSDVGPGGEQRFWIDNRAAALMPPGNKLDHDRMRRLSEDYVSLLGSVAPGNRHVVDKMPGNYSHLGLIHVGLPNAKIVHVRRNPIDTCLSIWTTPNSAHIAWGNDKRAIVFAYREYLRIMEHWRETLPSDRLLEIDYEDLVSNPADVTQKMLAFCGLEWEDACLHPEDNSRAVATPSDWQVRQPINRNSIDRWRKFEPWLDEFLELAPKGG